MNWVIGHSLVAALCLTVGVVAGYHISQRQVDKVIDQLVDKRIDQRVMDETGISLPKWKSIEAQFKQKREDQHGM